MALTPLRRWKVFPLQRLFRQLSYKSWEVSPQGGLALLDDLANRGKMVLIMV